MNRLIQVLCFSCLFSLNYSSELQYNDKDAISQVYNVTNLVGRGLSHIQDYHRLKSQPLHLQLQPVLRNLLFQLQEYSSENSTKCFRDLLHVVQNLNGASGLWAIKMLDSYGKPASGILDGHLKWIGEYTECIQVYAPAKNNSTTGNFHGQYCSLGWSVEITNFSLTVTSGVCLPDSCSSSEILGNVSHLLLPVAGVYQSNGTDFPVKVSSLTCKPREKEWNAPAIAVIVLMSIFCAMTILGSFVTAMKYLTAKKNPYSEKSSLILSTEEKVGDPDDELLLEHGKFHGYWEKCEPFLQCFCVFSNGGKLLRTTGGEGELLCIHGIRFLSMSWVILGHAYMFGYQASSDVLSVATSARNFPFQIILQAFFSVDSFFVLSGFLMTYLFLQQYAKNKNEISWPYFYIHRYVRLTPVYMIVLGFSASVFLYLGSGPLWPDNDVDPICKDKWWQHLLYINNFGDWSKQCMGWSWYLANDMQFFAISPIFLIPLARWPKVGCCVVAAFLCACWLVNFILTYQYDLLPGMIFIPYRDVSSIDVEKYTQRILDYSDKLYSKPYTRIAPYLIGMITGYILFARKQANMSKHSWVTLVAGWSVASVITLATVYGLFHSDPSLIARCFYNALSRTLFAVGLSWVIYVCLIEQGGPVNAILSFRMFVPLSRLTYSAYLIHPLILTGYYSNLKQLVKFSHPTVVLLFLGFMVATYALSFPVALVFESPIIGLEKLIRTRFTKKEKVCSERS